MRHISIRSALAFLQANPIQLHTEADFAGMRKAGRLAADTIDFVTPLIRPGITTASLNDFCHHYILSHDGHPAPLELKFPAATCISVNNIVCHGLPGSYRLRKRDIVNVDVSVRVDGWYGDTSRMFAVGEISEENRKLINASRQAMMAAIEKVKPGQLFINLKQAMTKVAQQNGFSLPREFSLVHGIGKALHMKPRIFGRENAEDFYVLKPGMFFAIEPILNAGSTGVHLMKDGHSMQTDDLAMSAQFEHTVGVTETGCEIFTLSSKGYTKPPYDSPCP